MPFAENAQLWLTRALDSLSYPDSWLSGRFTDFDAWRAHARGVLQNALGKPPSAVPLDVRVQREEDRGTYTATLLDFRVDSAYRTEAYLLVPHGKGPFPTVIALHDHGAFFAWGKEKLVSSPDSEHPSLREHVSRHYGGRFVADELAKRGYLVLSIDEWLWGMKRVGDVPGAADLDLSTEQGISRYHRLVPELERQMTFALLFAGETMPGHLLYADRRSLDLLWQDSRVDRSRVACIGLSVGGFRTLHLAAIDERIQAAVEIGWMCSLASYLRDHDHLYRWPNTIGMCTPNMARHLDIPDLVAMACPKPYLLMAGRQDALYPLGSVEEAFGKIRATYESQGVPERVETRWYDVPHCFDVPMQEYAYDWLDRSL